MQSKKSETGITPAPPLKVIFSGHDSFLCKQFWLKKGYDFIIDKNDFRDEKAVVKLGVGKNMVGAVHYWMKGFGIISALVGVERWLV